MHNPKSNSQKVIISIGGVDSLNGGGVTTDLQVFKKYGFFSAATISCVVSVESDGIDIFPVSDDSFAKQLISISTLAKKVVAIKIGLLATPTQVDLTTQFIRKIRTVNKKFVVLVDPVFALKEDSDYRDREMQIRVVGQLVPLASVLTPNLDEWHIIQENSVVFHDLQARNVPIVVTDANIKDEEFAEDNLIINYQTTVFRAPRIKNKPTAGAGCTFSASLVCELHDGKELKKAVQNAKNFTREAIENSIDCSNSDGEDEIFGVVNFQ